MAERHLYMVYDRESYGSDGERAPESTMPRTGPRYRVVHTVVGRPPYPFGWTQGCAAATTLAAAHAMIPPGCACTPRGPHHIGMVPIESWKAPEGADPGPLREAADATGAP